LLFDIQAVPFPGIVREEEDAATHEEEDAAVEAGAEVVPTNTQ
jgi:hypothetical protein